MAWNRTEAPKNEGEVIRLQFRYQKESVQTGKFAWNNRENAFVECIDGFDATALYPEDGWEVLGWRR